MKTRLQNKFTCVDVAALLAFAAMWIYYIVIVRYGLCFSDEHFYVTMAERFVQGDRPLVDEWHVAQFSSLFLCLPYKIYVALKGSTDGIILFMRYLFVAFNAFFYWFMYVRLRAYKWLSLIATLLFCAYIPGGLFACNYYTMPIRLLMIACLMLFAEKQRIISLFFTGVVLSCAVLYQPGFAILYVVFSALVWIRFFRKRKGKPFPDSFSFLLNLRTWKFLSLGVFVCAAVLLTWLLLKSGLRNILETIPYMLLTDPEYDFSAQGGAWVVVFRKLAEAVDIYGRACVVSALAVIALSAAYAIGLFRSRRSRARKILFLLACAVWMWSCVPTFRLLGGTLPFPGIFFKLYPAPLFWIGLAYYLLCEKKNKRFFFLWIVALLASLSMDLTSEIALAVGAPVSYIADLVFFTDLLRELREDQSAKKVSATELVRERKTTKRIDSCVRWLSRIACGFFAFWVACTLVRDNTIFPMHYLQNAPVRSFTYVCKTGPIQSICYPETNGQYYSKTLADIDTLKEAQTENLFIYGMAPELYLYADLPYATFDSWIWRKEVYLNRVARYWALHPERQPACVYIPFFEAYEKVDNNSFSAESYLSGIRELFDPLCTYTAVRGQAGYILYISQWNLKPETGV